MKRIFIVVLVLSFFVGFTTDVFAGCEEAGYLEKTYPLMTKQNSKDARQDTLVLVNPRDFRALQPGAGKQLTDDKAIEFSEKKKNGELKVSNKELCKIMTEHEAPDPKTGKPGKPPKIGKVVIWNNEIWLVDGNHMAHAMDKSARGPMLVQVVENWNAIKTRQEFETKLREHHYLYLRDISRGKTLRFDELPKDVTSQSDEPYRTLADYAQSCAKKNLEYQKKCGAGALSKSPVMFTEFIWGDYLSRSPDIQKIMRDSKYKLPSEWALKQEKNAAEDKAIEAAKAAGTYNPENPKAALKDLKFRTVCDEPVVKLALDYSCNHVMNEKTSEIVGQRGSHPVSITENVSKDPSTDTKADTKTINTEAGI